MRALYIVVPVTPQRPLSPLTASVLLDAVHPTALFLAAAGCCAAGVAAGAAAGGTVACAGRCVAAAALAEAASVHGEAHVRARADG